MTPFENFASPIRTQNALRQEVTAAYRRAETECLPPLIDLATLPEGQRQQIAKTARKLIEAMRAKPQTGGVQSLVQEYSLSSQEGVALMCLAEALLRIPDAGTRDALIRDKIAGGDWAAHLGGGRSLFVNAATWGLLVTGKLTATSSEVGLGGALNRIVARFGEPVIRHGVDLAMRLMGEQFVTGETIEDALARAAALEAKGYRYSYDMLGEAAMTADDAARYLKSYENAIHAIGKSASRRGVIEGPGISVKLSALHPRYQRSQAQRAMTELYPRLLHLARVAKSYNIGFNIDAEEADRLELSLDLLEGLSFEAELQGWSGLGFVVQAYGKRCPFVIDFIIDLARRAKRRVMVRLVKGAYWDSEIKRAQVDGLPDYPVFTRKVHTDISYIACARKLLAAPDAVFPQFATHNAQTLATIYHLAGPSFQSGQYEFQCLHGMGEPLYDEVVGRSQLNRPARIYAPVGTHETLLAYLVRRLLENGANSSFVHRIADKDVSVSELITDPVIAASRISPIGKPHERIGLSGLIFAKRENSVGLDLSSEVELQKLNLALQKSLERQWRAAPILAAKASANHAADVVNPGRHTDVVGQVVWATEEDVTLAAKAAAQAWVSWNREPPSDRAETLERAAAILQGRMNELLGLIMREAGKTVANAIGEVREAVDFLRYYALQAREGLSENSEALGPVVCISPWNFPLAIFMGQIAAALAAGNSVLAKPAEETPLIAAEAIRILHEAGIPAGVLQFLPGDGKIGAALVAAPEIEGVMFTGSTEVARLINQQLAKRLSQKGGVIPLIAETGGQNAMIVDSSALPEQVVGDVITSAFDSAGQRCSALRVLCLQEDVADHILAMLKGALRELRMGETGRLAIDVGPVITAEAKDRIETHITAMKTRGHRVTRLEAADDLKDGTFVAPAIIEIGSISELRQEVFGPVLHVLRFDRNKLDELIGDINATGYGLTFGLHTRIDETIDDVTNKIHAGNIYINRNMIGAVVGSQPFGGGGLSGTGPKAGGPRYLKRLVRSHNTDTPTNMQELEGPVGERNAYALRPRGKVLCLHRTEAGRRAQLAAVEATGNSAFVPTAGEDWSQLGPYAAALIEGQGAEVLPQLEALAAMPGPIVPVQVGEPYALDGLAEEVSISTNTAAAGGNASLMTIG